MGRGLWSGRHRKALSRFEAKSVNSETCYSKVHMHGGEGGAAAHAEELGHMHEAGEEHND